MHTTARSFVLGAAFALAASLVGCGGHKGEQVSEAAPAGLVAEFTVRGRVVQLPDPDRPASEFRVSHEPIPEWKRNYNDEAPVGMRAMIMDFPPASPEVIQGVAIDDVVRLTFRVEYDAEGALKGWKSIRVERLPPETSLVHEQDPAGQ